MDGEAIYGDAPYYRVHLAERGAWMGGEGGVMGDDGDEGDGMRGVGWGEG